MKYKVIVVTLVSALMVASGCDTVRSFLGKPTSADLARMRADLERIEKERADSIARAVEKERADSIARARAVEAARLDSLQKACSTLSILKYNVIAGAFSDEANTAKFTEELRKGGYITCGIDFKNGMHAVCVMSSDNYDEAVRFLSDFRSSCRDGEDAWIYNSTTKKHISKQNSE